ncbi:BlaI/MecI/CopY family transcriptional regulator [Streptomyces sp. NPDC017936]|uniref:BlaI/MecI/CopY family transcriptional regulator n=1 Tax=Streptomyces sp. NPDC017936 TaxID=3365016 RepID=UPI00378B6D05
MADEPEVPTTQSLQSQYEAQFAHHLTENREEQARLRKRLEQLVVDEAWLVKALEAVSAPAKDKADTQTPEDESARPQDNTTKPAEPADVAEPAVEASSALPKQRRDKPAAAKKTAVKKTTAKKTTAKKAPAKKAPAAKKTAAAEQAPAVKKTAVKSGEPPLGELLLSILRRHTGQPRTAGEVVSDLEREYPERARDINTVRNALERLVAKSLVERTKQKNTVLYTVVAASAPAADDTAAEASPAAEASEDTEKVPVKA